MVSQSKEMFINMNPRNIPDGDSDEYKDFWKNERYKCEYGVNIGGYWVSGWLYMHINHWNIEVFVEDLINKKTKRSLTKPQFRDIEFIIAENLTRAEKEKKGLAIVGARRLGKSEFSASYIGRNAVLFKGTENVVTSGNEADIKLLSDKIDRGLVNLSDYFRMPRIEDNWKKQVTLGIKDKRTGFRKEWSKILIRNFDNGNNTEAVAGTTAFSFIMDEFLKFASLKCLEASKPAFASPFGWACVPILTATGGNVEASSDGKDLCENPDAHNFLVTHLPEENNKKFVVFIPGSMSLDVPRIETPFSDFLKKKEFDIEEKSELNDIIIHEADIEKGIEIVKEKREIAKKSNDPSVLNKAIMYSPLTTNEVFMVNSDNDFPIEAIDEQLLWMSTQGIEGQAIELFKDASGIVKHKFSSKKPIRTFPHKKDDDLDAPIMVYEFPIDTKYPNVYIAAADPYNASQAAYSDSLGTVYIYKRMVDISGEKFQNMIVASYAARPENINTWHETVDMLMEWYNAVIMPENANPGLIQYFDQKNESYRVADGMSFLREISPNTTITRPKGLPATVPVIKFCMELLIRYCKEVVDVGTDKDGNVIRKLGVTRILDPLLLEEMKKYDGKNKEGNYDRIVAFRHAIAYTHFLDKYYPIAKIKQEQEEKKPPVFKKIIKHLNNPFFKTKSPFFLK